MSAWAGKEIEPLWNNDWLKPYMYSNLHYDNVIDAEVLKKVTPVITFRERRAYESLYYIPTDEEIKNSVTIATL